MENKLHIVTNIIPGPEVLYISNENRDYPYLAYKGIDTSITSIYEGSSVWRPIHSRELENILDSCGSMMGGLVFVYPYSSNMEEDQVYPYYLPPVLNPDKPSIEVIPSITLNNKTRDEIDAWTTGDKKPGREDSIMTTGIKLCDSWDAGNISDFEENIINPLYQEYISETEAVGESQVAGGYSSEYPVVLELVANGTYTDTLDINGVIYNKKVPSVSGKIDLCVSWSEGGEIYGESRTFKAFEYTDDGDLVLTDRIIIAEGVQIEYTGGIISVFPLRDTIDEFIISDCVITYGNID